MIPEKYIELMNKEIDGVNDPEERPDLNSYLAANPEAMAFFRELSGVTAALDRISEIEPPPSLKNQILSSLPANKPDTMSARGIVWSMQEIFTRRKGISYALAFIVGVLAGVVLLSAFRSNAQRWSDLSDLYGTLSLNESGATLESVSHLDIAVGDLSGTADLKSSRRYTIAEIHISSSRDIEIVLEYKDGDIKINSVGATGGLIHNIAISKNSVQVANRGENTYVFAFDEILHSDQPLNLKLLASGQLLYEHRLSTEMALK